MIDQLEQDQEDFLGRLLADEYLADVAILSEAKGVIESDIDQALSILNERSGKIGACLVVLMPSLTGETPDAPGPRMLVRMTVQVIEQPLINRSEGGTLKSASQIAERVRMLLHHVSLGLLNVYAFAAQEPIPVSDDRVSYGVAFTRVAGDCPPRKVAMPSVALSSPTAPTVATLTCATAGASIYYTVDGSYPSALNPTAVLYTVPVAVAAPSKLRAVGILAGNLQSNPTLSQIA